jgi:hypothetical protein
MYRLHITRFEPNPNYAEELKAWNDTRRYGPPFDGASGPMPDRELRSLEVVLTDEEFEAVKRAVLEVM